MLFEEVIIIGAGPSGIAAASKLIENNVTNIKILEAADRIGGRIHSVFFKEAFVDLGAEFVEGKNGNIVYQLAKDYINPINGDTIATAYDYRGYRIDPEVIKDVMNALDNFEPKNNTPTDISMGDEFLLQYNSTVLQKYKNNSEKHATAVACIDLCELEILLVEGSYNWTQSLSKTHFEDCEGEDHNWNGLGYKTIIDILLKRFPFKNKQILNDNKILLNKPVTKIIWNDTKVDIICEDGTTLTTKHVIFTPSVGVLKATANQLFEPKLPQYKLDAIEAIGFSGVMKVILSFPSKWWNSSDFPLEFVWRFEDKINVLKEFSEGPAVDGVSWLTRIIHLLEVPKNPKVLVVWITGPHIPQIENLSENTLKNGVMFVIRKFLSKKYQNISDPDSIIRSRWVTDPYTRGTYSYETVETMKLEEHYPLQLQKPLVDSQGIPRVLFAGEATHPTKYATVHGAIETGFREAENLIKLFKTNKVQ